MSMYRIGFVIDDALDKPDGVQQYVLTVGEWMRSQGHDVHYITSETKRTDIPNIHSAAKNVVVRFNQNKMAIPLPADTKRIKSLLQAYAFDVLHVQVPYSPLLAARVINRAGHDTAVVGTFHILPYSGLEKNATKLLGAMLRSSSRRFDDMVAVSDPARAFALESFNVRAQVIPNAVPLKDFRITAPRSAVSADGQITIAFLGRLVPRKGVLELVRAVAALPAELRSRVRLRIGGKGELEPALNDLLAKTGLAGLTSYEGFIAESDKAAFLRSADIAVFPALSGESFGIVLIEAMAAGAGVVIGGDNPGYRSVLGAWPNALVRPSDTTSFAQMLEKLMINHELRQQLHREQQQAVLQYDIEVVGPRIEDVYEKALHNRRNA